MNNSMKKCVNCGREIPAGYGFCKYCGAKQPSNNEASMNSGASTASNNGHNYKIVTDASKSSSYDADEAVNEANQRTSLANQRAEEAENEVKDAKSLKQAQTKEQQALKRAKAAERKARKMNSKSLRLKRKTQKVQQQANDAQQSQRVKEQELQKKASPKYIKKHHLHLLIWTYFMPVIALAVFCMIGGNMKEPLGDIVISIGIGVVSIIAIVMACVSKKWYKKSSIGSIVWNAIWILMAIAAVMGN